MPGADVVYIAAIAAGAALGIVFVTCIVFSVWICVRMRKDEDGQWSVLKEKYRRQRLRKKFHKQFTHNQVRLRKSAFLRVAPRRESDGTRDSMRTGYGDDEELDHNCSVCLEPYAGDSSEIMVGFLSPCRHYFHFDCLWQWLETQTNCPICRKDVTFDTTDVQAVTYSHILNCNIKVMEPKFLDNGSILTIESDSTMKFDRGKTNDSLIFSTSTIVPTYQVPTAVLNMNTDDLPRIE